jgi:threonine/homoserine/homoserine lactone efflux protein
MLDRTAVLTVFRVYLAGVVIPGPDFVTVAHKAVAGTGSEALALVAGIVVVNLLWSCCAITGLGLMFAAFPWAALSMVRGRKTAPARSVRAPGRSPGFHG